MATVMIGINEFSHNILSLFTSWIVSRSTLLHALEILDLARRFYWCCNLVGPLSKPRNLGYSILPASPHTNSLLHATTS